MPAPDVSYCLDCSFTVGHISADTYFYLMHLCPEANDVVDDYDRQPRRRFERHMDSLADMGLYFEDAYLQWRAKNRDLAILASAAAARMFPEQIMMLADSEARHQIGEGTNSFSPDDMSKDFARSLAIVRRSHKRMMSDLEGLDRSRIGTLEKQYRALLAAHRAACQAEIAIDDGAIQPVLQDIAWDDLPPGTGTALAKSYIKRRRETQSTMKRSVKFLSKLIGYDKTRIFVSGDRLTFEGEHCIYELKKTGSLSRSHGSARLSVFTKQDDIHLCDLCIYTPKTPVLDHVANIVMHLQAGEEEEILKIGNPYNIKDRAREEGWLMPYLPPPVDPNITRRVMLTDDFREAGERLNRHERHIEPMKRRIARWIVGNLDQPFLPVMKGSENHALNHSALPG